METRETVKAKYDPLAVKYSLPKWDVIDKEFELLYIDTVIEIRNPLPFIINRIGDRLNTRLENLQAIINPPPSSMILIKEHSFLNDDDKKLAIKTMTQIMPALVNSKLISSPTDKVLAEVLLYRLETWKSTRKPYAAIIKRLEDGWKKTSKS